jgi:broad specificity phosphatase PhoE
MKWPQQLILVRHAESAYNALKHRMRQDPAYRQFLHNFEHQPMDPSTHSLAEQLHSRYPVRYADMQTPLAPGAGEQARQLGTIMRRQLEIPDVVYVSPYVRTWATLSQILHGWPELARTRVIEEERIREQEFGDRIMYSDWRFYFTLNPDQRRLYDLQGPYWYRFPQGENIPDVRNRNRAWATSVTRDFANQRVLAITHHMNILSFRANMERLSSQQFLDMERQQPPANCSVTTYRGEPKQGNNGRLILEQYDTQLT